MEIYILLIGIIAIVLLLFVILICPCIAKYNTMIKYKNSVLESLRLIDIHLKLRFDLIPNLVECVKGYCKHEERVFSKLIGLREKALKTDNEVEKLEYANETIPNIRHVLAISENYPELKADALFKSLMDELVLIEDKIVASRRFYDSNVSIYNTYIESFPNSIIAGMFHFERMELYKIDAGENIIPNINMERK